MKIALVHDYLKELGGAERVLRTLSDMYPEAPIYTAFQIKGSVAVKEFGDRKVRQSFLAPVLKIWRLHSPLRFLAPFIWRSMDLSKYDVVITSASWYISRGFRVGKNTKVICYCHTPPRYLYGYETSIDLQKYLPVRIYAVIVNHILRIYDAWSVRTVDKWVVNSKNVRERVRKFYRREAMVVYPPVEVEKIIKASEGIKKQDYFLIVSRLVGAKGLIEAARAAKELKFDLKIVGDAAGHSLIKNKLEKMGAKLLGRVSDKELYKLYAGAKGFISLAREEDFGMTVVEAQAGGVPVIAFNGGGFKESVISGVTGILIDDTDVVTLKKAMLKFNKLKWSKSKIQENAKRFDREKFEKKIKSVCDYS